MMLCTKYKTNTNKRKKQSLKSDLLREVMWGDFSDGKPKVANSDVKQTKKQKKFYI